MRTSVASVRRLEALMSTATFHNQQLKKTAFFISFNVSVQMQWIFLKKNQKLFFEDLFQICIYLNTTKVREGFRHMRLPQKKTPGVKEL